MKNKNKNILIGIGILVILVSGCVEEKKEPNQTNNQTQNGNQTKITEEQAIAIANATGEAQEFLKLYPDAELKTLQSCCASGKVLRSDMMCKCAANSKSDWMIEYLVGEKEEYYASVRIAVDEYSGKITARYPKLEYITNETYCESDDDCLCLGCSGVARPCCGCWNFIYNGKAFAGAWPSGDYCKCINNTCTALEPEKQSTAGDSKPAQASNVTSANNQFAFDLYSEFKDDEGNIFFSPYSISTALAMTYEGARGKTAQEMRSVFHFPENDTICRLEFVEIIERINKKDKEYELSTANALWAQKDYKFLDNYFNTIEQYYGGKVTNLDFVTETEKSRITINTWVENQTNNKIKNLIPQGVLDDMTRLVLTNAIYFKGNRAKQFDKENTLEADFKVTPGKTVKVRMMSLTGKEAKFNYTETPELQILELPYDGGELSMLIMLPREDNLQTIEELLNGGNLTGWKNNLMEQEVNVYLPKFTFETKYFMKETLEEMGMPTAFSMDADFSGMDGTDRLYISSVIHQAFVEVNEEGTEAAAATAVVMLEKGMPTTFRADHPFIFIIREKETGSILFLGRVVNPKE